MDSVRLTLGFSNFLNTRRSKKRKIKLHRYAVIAPIRMGERTEKKVENHAEIAWLFAIDKISKAIIPKNMAVIFIFLFVSKFNVKHQLPLRDNFLSFPRWLFTIYFILFLPNSQYVINNSCLYCIVF